MKRIFFKRYCAREDGLAAVEFALLAPFLILMLIGIMDFGMYINQRMQFENLSRAAAEYVVKGGSEANIMADVIMGSGKVDEEDAGEMEFESSNVCECSDGEEIICGSTCEDGYERRFYEFSMTHTYTPMFSYPGIPDSIAIRGHSRMQIQ